MWLVMKIGFSIYLGTDEEKNEDVICKAVKAKMEFAFTSLHIPEENVINYRSTIKGLLAKCNVAGIKLIADISPHTLEKLDCVDYEELLDLGFDYIRPDFGYSDIEIVALSKKFHLVFNASTMSIRHVKAWESLGADLTRFIACHNFYPKPLSGLSFKKVSDMNKLFRSLGMMTMTFVAGNLAYREPLFLGLPTVEKQRNGDVFLNMLELFDKGASDIVLIGDVDVSDDVWERIRDYHEGYISLRCAIEGDYKFVRDIVHHDRPDSSEYVIRSQESRFYDRKILQEEVLPRPMGTVFISNEAYLRYEGELEIARVDLAGDKRVNVIGSVLEDNWKYLPYVKDGMGFKLV